MVPLAVTTSQMQARDGLSVRAAGGAIALSAVLYAWPLTLQAPLVDPDEGLHAAIAQDMLDRGELVMPRFLGEPFLDKPILYFWALRTSLGRLGPTEVAVRLPGLVFGWLGAATTALLAGQLVGRRVAVLAFCLHATTIVPLALGQVAVHDVALVPWTNLALLCLWRADRSVRASGAFGAAAIAGVFVGLSVLTKGLVGVALVGVPFAVLLVLARRLTARICLAGLLALAIGALIATPWYLAMERIQPGYLHYFFVERHVMGFATTMQTHGQRPWWYYLPILAGGGWPWILYAPLAARRSHEEVPARGRRLIWTWLAVDVVILSLARSKLVTYLLPVFPAAAILAAIAWDDRRPTAGPSGAAARWPRAMTAAVWVHAIVGVVLVPVSLVFAQTEFGIRFGWAAWIGGAALVAGYVYVLAAWRDGRASRALAAQIGLVAATFVLLMSVAFGPLARQLSARPLAQYLDARGAMPAHLWVVDERIGSVVFYLDPALRRDLTPARIENVPLGLLLGRLPTAPPDVLVALADRDLPRFERGLNLAGVPFDQAGRHRVYTADALRDRALKIVGGR